LSKLILLGAGLGGAIELRVLGAISVAEIFLLMGWLYALPRVRALFTDRAARALLLCGGVWFAFQVATDLFRGTPIHDWARGWMRIVIFLSHFAVLYVLLRENLTRFVWLAAGLALGLLAQGFLKTTYLPLGMAWKFGLALPVLWLACLAFSRWPRSPFYGATLLALVAVNFALSFRSFSGVCVAALGLWVALLFLQRRAPPVAFHKCARWLAAGSVGGLLAGVVVFSNLALLGVFGEAEQFRTELQMRRGIGLLGNSVLGEHLGLIAGGRGEFVIALRAIGDAPLLGHGSWAKNFQYADMWMAMAGEEKLSEIRLTQIEEREPGLIPSHSHILGAWVEAGLGGGIFWGAALVVVYAALALCLCTPQPYATWLLPVFTLFIWDIFFSPFGTQSRLFSALNLALAALLLERNKPSAPARARDWPRFPR
jgi:hypothetical protein